MENELYNLYDLIETKTNLFNIICKGTGYFEFVELKRYYSFDNFNENFYYTGNGNDYYTLLYGDNQEDYLTYLDDFDEYQDYTIGLGLINPLLLIKLIDNEETIKKLLKLETVIIDCDLCKLEITPVTQ